jgi:hypothetical protein
VTATSQLHSPLSFVLKLVLLLVGLLVAVLLGLVIDLYISSRQTITLPAPTLVAPVIA